ncbi:peptide/nickel transport system permease protein [Devosia sp. YR412]|uniref:ABC transporter permease n=1 Tax=Devosia sp. YR412 TaxID=1881030 RepID=UPI0008D17FC4|nr:ABC transporter permease [Devosia sp. YR412]SEQ10756.1 peptide/nickel transport system permease protein [Devosia sp. YR412]
MQTEAKVLDPRITASASQWRLIWGRFRKHKLAMAGLVIVTLLYLVAAFAEFFQPFDPNSTASQDVYHPPQAIRFFEADGAGNWSFRPHVIDMVLTRDPLTLTASYAEDPDAKTYIHVLGYGEPYRLAGLIPMQHKLIAAEGDGRFYLFGADRMGRDLFSRTVSGTRISMSIGLIGVAMSLVLGMLVGGVAGYFAGWFDRVSSRVIELIMAMPTIPIWLGLSAAIPANWDPMTRYFAITVILSLVGWTELARVVRGRFFALKTEDFVVAARLDGARPLRVIFRHMMPSLASHIIASVSLAIPVMILAETSLSFLGLGLLPPSVSWGVLLKEAQNIRAIATAPWLFIPGIFVALAVLSLNFLGDGLRDAADPYAQERG